ncbi:MAG TPA: hypothetical protein VF834_24120 [Streptosporangiaceae bacterium]
MIRRALWLAVGAVLGITGYRRLTRLARGLAPRGGAAPLDGAARRVVGRFTPAQLPGPPSSRPASGPAARRAGAQMLAFARDVRAGMAEYLDARDGNMNRQSGRQGNNLVVRPRTGVRASGSDNPKDGR